MTCLTERTEGIACIACGRTDQVYLGHGIVRFCAHCSISWDPIEDGISLDFQIKTVVLSEGQEEIIPEDMVERIGGLAGAITNVFGFERRLADVLAIPEALFVEDDPFEIQTKSLEQKAPIPPWQTLVDTFSPVMQLVHDAMRMKQADTDMIADELFKARKTEFNDAVSDYTAKLGCAGTGDLKSSAELKFFRDDSNRDAENITLTYNLDLAKIIQNTRIETPTANRNTYTKGLRQWDASRRDWKSTQISLWTVTTSRDQALKSFAFHNNLKPKVRLMPRLAKEPICQGWLNRGTVSFEVAVRNPSPYHVNCIHFWEPEFDIDTLEGDCTDLWKG